MLKKEFFLKAMAAGLYNLKAWTFSAFSIIREDFSKWKSDNYPYRIVQTPTGIFYVDPSDINKLILIEDGVPGEPLFTFKEPIELKVNDVPNLKKDITSTIGNVFFNYCCLVYPFGSKLDYIEGKANIKSLENKIANLLLDTPDANAERDSKFIYVDEYIKFVDALQFLTNFTQLCVWAATAKTMLPPPGLKEFKEKLLAKYEGHLTDPSVIAIVVSELVKFDSEYLKGDSGENFLLDGKAKKARNRLFLMYGAEAGLSGGVEVDLIKNSLLEGWEVDKFPAMNNALRAGSFNRGKETQLGGESVKWLLRASSNIMVPKDDCGSRLGKKFTVTKSNAKKLVNFSIITEEGSKLITTDEEAGVYLGKTLMVRSPMYCKLPMTDFCKVCIGTKLSLNPTGISLAISEYGSSFMSIFMAAMHNKQLTLAKMNYKIELN